MKAEKNPFRSSAVAKLRYRISDPERHALTARLRLGDWRGCIIGPEGSGKTTLLEDLEESVRADGIAMKRVGLRRESSPEERQAAFRHITGMRRGECCFLDGGEVLGWFGWRRLIRRVRANGCGLVATVHRPCPLPVIYRTETEVERALSLAKELAGACWNGEMETAARAAFEKSRGNVREVFRACYWHCARCD